MVLSVGLEAQAQVRHVWFSEAAPLPACEPLRRYRGERLSKRPPIGVQAPPIACGGREIRPWQSSLYARPSRLELGRRHGGARARSLKGWEGEEALFRASVQGVSLVVGAKFGQPALGASGPPCVCLDGNSSVCPAPMLARESRRRSPRPPQEDLPRTLDSQRSGSIGCVCSVVAQRAPHIGYVALPTLDTSHTGRRRRLLARSSAVLSSPEHKRLKARLGSPVYPTS